MSETYSVVVSGQLVEGFELDQVKENITRAFKLSSAQVDKLLCGKPVALKRGIEKSVAVKLSTRLQGLGAVSTIKAAAEPAKAKALKPEPPQAESIAPTPVEASVAAVEPEPAVGSEQHVEQETTTSSEQHVEQEATASGRSSSLKTLDCPRCGHSQPVSDSCQLCKMDLTLHLRRSERRAQVVANILKERQASNT